MSFNLFAIFSEPADAGGFWEKPVDSLVYPALLALLIWTAKIARGWRSTRLANRQAFSGLKSEITRVHVENEKLRKLLEENFANGELQRRMSNDARYFLYIAQGRSSNQVFDTKTRDFSFLSDRCFELLVDYYDTQSLLTVCLADMRSDAFRELSIPRKENALRNILNLLVENQETYAKCQKSLDRQSRYLQGRRRNCDHGCRDG